MSELGRRLRTVIPSEELLCEAANIADQHKALIAIKDAVSDYFCGKKYPEFAKENGGAINLEVAMKIKLEHWEEEFNEVSNDKET